MPDTPLTETLKKLRGKRKLDAMAVLMGVHKNTIVNYERGDRLPDIDFLAVLASHTGHDFIDLIRLRLEASGEELARSQAHALPGAGTSTEPPPRSPCRDVVLPLCPEILARSTPLPDPPWESAAQGSDRAGRMAERIQAELAYLCLWHMTGPSMEPTIGDGDIVLLDTRAIGAEHEGIYVLLSPADGLWVKRLQILPGGMLRLSADNPAFEPFTIARAEFERQQISVLGRIVRILGKL